MKICYIRTRDEYAGCFRNSEPVLKKEQEISKNFFVSNKKKSHLIGFCDICRSLTLFMIDDISSYNHTINFRERLVCRRCGLNNRMRFMLYWILKQKPDLQENIYIQEQVTGFYRILKKRFPSIVGSEYLGENIPGGKIINGIRHENAEKLSFKDETFSLLISCDVFEHVSDLGACFKEAARVLRPGGKMIFSIPFLTVEQYTKKRAEIRNGELCFLMEPQYHGNPLSEKGSLVFNDISWDSFELLKKHGFTDAWMTTYYSRTRGYMGDGLQYIFEAVKE